jgi:hypothetical protein
MYNLILTSLIARKQSTPSTPAGDCQTNYKNEITLYIEATNASATVLYLAVWAADRVLMKMVRYCFKIFVSAVTPNYIPTHTPTRIPHPITLVGNTETFTYFNQFRSQ